MLQIFKELGVLFALAKCERLATVLTFLGIEIDTVKQEVFETGTSAQILNGGTSS